MFAAQNNIIGVLTVDSAESIGSEILGQKSRNSAQNYENNWRVYSAPGLLLNAPLKIEIESK